MSNPQAIITEADLIYAVNILDAVGEGFDRLTAQPKLAPQISMELLQNSGEIFDALLAICQPKFRIVLYDLGRKAINAVKTCQMKKRK